MDEEDVMDEEDIMDEGDLGARISQTQKATVSTEGDETSEDDVERTGSIELLEFDLGSEKSSEKAEEEEFLKNPGINEAYMLGTVKIPEDELDEAVYLRLVKEAKIMPIKRITSGLRGSAIRLQYYGLDCMQIKPLSEALMNNTSVQELNLKSNILTLDALYHLGLMLRKNISLRTLNLSQCKITAEGIDLLGSGLEICPHLTLLDLSYNDFGDKGMEILAEKLCYNTSVTKLNLSHNDLTHKTGFYLAETMEENYTLHHLDLSWNQISEDQGLKRFLHSAAEHNESMLSLDLSWNTLSGEKTANIIKTFIAQHRSLHELNIAHNRFETAAEVTKIAKGINSALSLKVLNLSFNGITADTAFTLLSNINTKTKLKTLRMDNVWVKPECEKLRRELERQTQIKIIVEGVSGGYGAKGPDMQTMLLKRAHHLGYLPKKAKNKKDFGWFLLRLQKADNLVPVKKAKYEKLVLEDKIKFDEGMVDELAKKFRDENKKIDLNLMLEKYLLLYPETALPIPKEKKKKKSTKNKSEIESLKLSKKSKTSSAKLKEEVPEDETAKSQDEQSPTDIPGQEIKEKERESITSKKEITIVDESEGGTKETEEIVETEDVEGTITDEQINQAELPKESDKNAEQIEQTEQKTQDITTQENEEQEKEVENQDNIEEIKPEEKTDNIIVEEEKTDNIIVEEEQKEEEAKDEEAENVKYRTHISIHYMK